MKFLKREKGFTLIDITVAIIVILLFMSLISVLFFNLTKSSKGIERESQATYIATNILEAYKTIDYDEIQITPAQGMEIVDGQTIGTKPTNPMITINDGYSAIVIVTPYTPTGESDDLVKKIKVIVSYKLANQTKTVELETSVVRK